MSVVNTVIAFFTSPHAVHPQKHLSDVFLLPVIFSYFLVFSISILRKVMKNMNEKFDVFTLYLVSN